jgi:hypothetical protein
MKPPVKEIFSSGSIPVSYCLTGPVRGVAIRKVAVSNKKSGGFQQEKWRFPTRKMATSFLTRCVGEPAGNRINQSGHLKDQAALLKSETL